MIVLENEFKEWFGDRKMPKNVDELYQILMGCSLGKHLKTLEDELYRREMDLLDREQTLVMKEKMMNEAVRDLEHEIKIIVSEKFGKIKLYRMHHGLEEITDREKK